MPSNLVISKAGPESGAILRNLFEHYLHDMSEWLGFDIGADGSYSYDTSRFWANGFDVHLVRVGDTLSGFALVSPADQWLGDIGAHQIAEFFVLRKYRRTGISHQIAERLWNQYPGEWLVRVLEVNVPAVPFWNRAIARFSNGRYTKERRIEKDRPWLFFRFRSGGLPSAAPGPEYIPGAE
jgi:predicted acetyltransferase